jgi:hypothetical protein
MVSMNGVHMCIRVDLLHTCRATYRCTTNQIGVVVDTHSIGLRGVTLISTLCNNKSNQTRDT